jgi:hypothetical protein
MTITLSEQYPLGKLFLPRVPFAVVITGTREPFPERPIMFALRQLPGGSRIIGGDATGVDAMAAKVCEHLDRPFIKFDAYWGCDDYERSAGHACQVPMLNPGDAEHPFSARHLGAPHGRAAGPARNRRMLRAAEAKEGEQVITLAFHDDLDASRGTKDCVRQSLQAGHVTMLVTSDERWVHVLAVK